MAFDAFLKLDGITGGSVDAKHQNEIDILGFAWDVRSGTVGSPRFSEIVLTKALDRSTPALFQKVCTGTPIGGATLTVRRVGKDQQDFLKIVMTNASVSRLAPTGDPASPVPMEQLGLKFTDVSISYRKQNIDGSLGSEITTTC